VGIGLAIGTRAPDFELSSLAGDSLSLQSLRARGRDVMLVFSSPFCESCAALAKKLVKWMREMEGLPQIVIISRGKAEDNRAKLQDFDAARVLLQQESEVSSAYDSIATPTAVLVGADGIIRSGLATGAPAIQALLTSSRKVEERKRINRQAPV
jgi:peroxiredoxin